MGGMDVSMVGRIGAVVVSSGRPCHSEASAAGGWLHGAAGGFPTAVIMLHSSGAGRTGFP